MSSKESILQNIRRNKIEKKDMPEINIQGIEYSNKIDQFIKTCEFVGGKAVLLENKEINQVIKELYPEAKNICSNVEGINIATMNDQAEDPHQLKDIDLSIIQGEIGVAENACVWISQNVENKVIYFIAEYLLIILEKDKIVNNMHEAYKIIQPAEKGFGVFISGPSKTADIEQALVIGAHGPKGLTVILK